MNRIFLSVLLVLAASGPVYAQTKTDSDSTVHSSESADWLLLPYASYAPDTKFAGGITFGYYLPSTPDQSASSIQATLTVTQERQLIASVTPELYIADGLWRVQSDFKATHYPNTFYGIGGETPARAKESYTARYVHTDVTVQRRLYSHLRVGPRVVVRTGSIRDPESNGLIAQKEVVGARGGLVTGLGVTAFWDSRDNRYYPTTGSFVETILTMYSSAWGSDYTFQQVATDLRGYRSLGPGVVAAQVYLEAASNGAPFQFLPLLGGSSRMRGYQEGRFRDNLYWTVQTEYRFPLFWRLKGVAFGSVGEVGPQVGKDLTQDVEVAVGVGGRFRFTDDGVHGRMDIAYSPTGMELYMSLGEAF